MNKVFISFAVLILFSASLSAESSYMFSSFGGGLPSSAVKTADVDLQTVRNTQVEKLSSSTSSLSTGEIVWITVGTVFVAATIAGTLIWLSNASPEGKEEFWAECGETCSELCTEDCTEGCSESSEYLCNSAVEETCNGSVSVAALSRMPVYVP